MINTFLSILFFGLSSAALAVCAVVLIGGLWVETLDGTITKARNL